MLGNSSNFGALRIAREAVWAFTGEKTSKTISPTTEKPAKRLNTSKF